MADRYWVGNGGNWDDTAHWSATSGGSGGVTVPTSSDDVFFDNLSFSTSAQTVLLNSSTTFHNLRYTPQKTTTFDTGSNSIVANRITIETGWGLTLNLGSSTITTHGWSYHITDDTNGASTLNSGTSHITVTPPFSDYGFENISFVNPETYYDITIQGDGTTSPGYVGGAFYFLGSSGFTCHSLTFSNEPLNVVWRDFQGGIYDTAYTAGTFTANGSTGKLFTFTSDSPGDFWKISATNSSLSYIDVADSMAGGTIPFRDCNGVDSGGNTHWVFNCNMYLQNVFMVGADSSGDVQTINTGKDDNSSPIFYEVETQDLDFGDRTHRKVVSDKIVVFTKNGDSSSFQVKADDTDYVPVDVSLNGRVNIGQQINVEGFFFNFKWSGTSDSSSPIFEGIYLERITDKGIVYG